MDASMQALSDKLTGVANRLNTARNDFASGQIDEQSFLSAITENVSISWASPEDVLRQINSNTDVATTSLIDSLRPFLRGDGALGDAPEILDKIIFADEIRIYTPESVHELSFGVVSGLQVGVYAKRVSLTTIDEGGLSLKGTLFKDTFNNGKRRTFLDWKLDASYDPTTDEPTFTPSVNFGSQF